MRSATVLATVMAIRSKAPRNKKKRWILLFVRANFSRVLKIIGCDNCCRVLNVISYGGVYDWLVGASELDEERHCASYSQDYKIKPRSQRNLKKRLRNLTKALRKLMKETNEKRKIERTLPEPPPAIITTSTTATTTPPIFIRDLILWPKRAWLTL